MSLPERSLGEGEKVVHDLRTHWKAMIAPALAVPVLVGVASYAIFSMPDGNLHRAGQYAVLVVAIALLAWRSVWPFARWRTTSYVLTNRRVAVRSGVFSRTGRDVPLHRINDVSFTRSFVERMLGCGTLVIESAGERGQLSLADIPGVENVQREVYRLMDQDDLRRRRWGDDPDETAYDAPARG